MYEMPLCHSCMSALWRRHQKDADRQWKDGREWKHFKAEFMEDTINMIYSKNRLEFQKMFTAPLRWRCMWREDEHRDWEDKMNADLHHQCDKTIADLHHRWAFGDFYTKRRRTVSVECLPAIPEENMFKFGLNL